MRMGHEQHVAAVLKQRHRLVDGLLNALVHVSEGLSRAVVHGHPLAGRQGIDPLAFHRRAEHSRAVAPHIPAAAVHLRDRLSGAPFSAAIIPFRQRRHGPWPEPRQGRRLLCALQRAGEYAFRVERLREQAADAVPGVARLLLANLRQRNVGPAGMLPRLAPCRLPMPEQDQPPQCGGTAAVRFAHVPNSTHFRVATMPNNGVYDRISG